MLSSYIPAFSLIMRENRDVKNYTQEFQKLLPVANLQRPKGSFAIMVVQYLIQADLYG